MSAHPAAIDGHHDGATQFDRRKLIAPAIISAAVLIMLGVGGLTQDAFLSIDNLLTVIRAAALVGIAAAGMTFITLTGNFVSLSTQQTAIIAGIVFAIELQHGWPVAVAIIATLAIGIVIGLLQGVIVALGMNPIVTTLGASGAIIGIANVITDNKTVNTHTDAASWLGTSRPLGVPTQVWAFLILIIVTMVVLAKTTFGRRVMLMGTNLHAAKSSGLRVAGATITAFGIASVCAAICGIFLVSQVSQAKTTNFDGFTIDTVAAVLVGGTSIQGGEGSTLRTALGALFIALLQDYMLISSFSYGVRLGIEGLVVGIAVLGFHILRTRAA